MIISRRHATSIRARSRRCCCATPACVEASVVGRPHPDWGEEVVAFVVARDGADVDRPRSTGSASTTSRASSGRKRYRFVDALPKNNYGKVLKTELRTRRHNTDMTLTELRYIVAVAREQHFGRAAEALLRVAAHAQRRDQEARGRARRQALRARRQRGQRHAAGRRHRAPGAGGDRAGRRHQGDRQARQGPAVRPAAAGHHLHHRAVPAAAPRAPGDRARRRRCR